MQKLFPIEAVYDAVNFIQKDCVQILLRLFIATMKTMRKAKVFSSRS